MSLLAHGLRLGEQAVVPFFYSLNDMVSYIATAFDKYSVLWTACFGKETVFGRLGGTWSVEVCNNTT